MPKPPRTNAQTFRRRFLLSGLLAFEEYLKISHKVGVHIAGVNFQTRFKVNDLQHIFYRPRKSEIGEREGVGREGRGHMRRRVEIPCLRSAFRAGQVKDHTS